MPPAALQYFKYLILSINFSLHQLCGTDSVDHVPTAPVSSSPVYHVSILKNLCTHLVEFVAAAALAQLLFLLVFQLRLGFLYQLNNTSRYLLMIESMEWNSVGSSNTSTTQSLHLKFKSQSNSFVSIAF